MLRRRAERDTGREMLGIWHLAFSIRGKEDEMIAYQQSRGCAVDTHEITHFCGYLLRCSNALIHEALYGKGSAAHRNPSNSPKLRLDLRFCW